MDFFFFDAAVDGPKPTQGVVWLFIFNNYFFVMCIYILGYTLVTPKSGSLRQEKMCEKIVNMRKPSRFSCKDFLCDQQGCTQTIKWTVA